MTDVFIMAVKEEVVGHCYGIECAKKNHSAGHGIREVLVPPVIPPSIG